MTRLTHITAATLVLFAFQAYALTPAEQIMELSISANNVTITAIQDSNQASLGLWSVCGERGTIGGCPRPVFLPPPFTNL